MVFGQLLAVWSECGLGPTLSVCAERRGQFCLLDEDYQTLTNWMRQIADEFSNGRLISALEGGYSLEGLAAGVKAHVGALL